MAVNGLTTDFEHGLHGWLVTDFEYGLHGWLATVFEHGLHGGLAVGYPGLRMACAMDGSVKSVLEIRCQLFDSANFQDRCCCENE